MTTGTAAAWRPARDALTAAAIATALAIAGSAASSWFLTDPTGLWVCATLATVTALPYTALVLWVDRHEKEPWWLLSSAFGWGAVVAAGLSMALNGVGRAYLTEHLGPVDAAWWTATLVAPPVEEALKALALVVIFDRWRHHTDDVLDGIVYGAMVGLGFAWFENVAYYMQGWSEGHLPSLVVGRGVVQGITGHATFTGLAGLGFGAFRVLRKRPIRWLLPAMGWIAAVGAHGAWNGASGWFITEAHVGLVGGTIVAALWLQVPFFGLLAIAAVLALNHQERLIRAHLLDEPDDIAKPADVDRLIPARRRLWRGLSQLVLRGPVAWWRHGRLTQALIRLAFARWHHREDAHPWRAEDDPDVLRWRAQVRRLRRLGARP